MIVADQTRASVTVFLDTIPPVLSISAPEDVEPPDEWEVVITANEPIGDALLDFRDAAGYLHQVGYARINDRTLRVVLPTMELASEWGTLEGLVTDTTCNATAVNVILYVRRPRPFDVEIIFGSSLTVDIFFDAPFEVDSDVSHSLDADTFFDGPFEVDSDLCCDLDVEVSLVGTNA